MPGIPRAMSFEILDVAFGLPEQRENPLHVSGTDLIRSEADSQIGRHADQCLESLERCHSRSLTSRSACRGSERIRFTSPERTSSGVKRILRSVDTPINAWNPSSDVIRDP